MSTTDEEVGEHVVTEDDVNNIIKETEKEMEVGDKTIQEENVEETTKSDVQTEQLVSEEDTAIKSEQDTSDYNNPEQVAPEQDVKLLSDDNTKQEQGILEEEPNIQTLENIPEVDTNTQPVQDVTENLVPDTITDSGFPEKSEGETVLDSAAIVDQVIQMMIKEFVVKSLEDIVKTEEIDTTFIHNLIIEIISSIDVDKVEIEHRISRASIIDESVKELDEITEVQEYEKLPDIVEEIEISKDVIKEIIDQIIVNEVLENIPYDEIDRKKLKQTMKDLIVLDIIQTFKSEEKIIGGKRTVATGMGTDEDFKEIKSGGEETSEETGEYHPTVIESREQVSEIEPEVLDPNNPLMKRFQIALKHHLYRQKNIFEEEILNLNGEMREQSKVEEDLSEQIYTIELKVNQQNYSLDQLLLKIQEYCSNCDLSTNLIGEQKTIYKEKSSNLDEVKRKDTELRIEVESLAALIKQFSEWEANQTSDITTTKLMSERHKVEKIKLFREKQKLDILLLAIRKDVLKLSTHNNDTIKLIQIKMKERADIEQGIVDANIDIEALISNNNRIMRLWRGNIVLISQRDKILLNMRENFEEHRKQFATLESQVEGITKETDELIKQNEKLTAKLQYIEKLFNANKKQLQEELEKRRTLRSRLHELTQMRDATEETLTGVMQELQFVQKNQIKSIDKFERLRIYRAELEEAIIKKIAEQTIETKTSRALNNKIVKQRIQLREKEVILSDLENAIAKVMVKIEKQKMLFDCGGIELEEIKEELRKKEVCVKKYQKELERTTTNGQLAQVQVDKQICRLAKLKEEIEESELTPEEIRIRELEKNISEMDEKTEHIKNFWMRQENHIVSISQQRSHQLQQISVLRKQLVILDKKNLKIEFDIQEQEKEEKKYNSIRSTIQKRLVKLNEQCYKTKGYKDLLDNNNLIIQNQYISDLKDAEDEYHKMHKEINDSETEKGELYNKITELQKEVLGWEKKLQLAVETRQLLTKLNADGGELANMKNEIHKMEIRYSQLRKAQENLAHDLELCISRRDGIVDFNRAREKQSNKGVHYNRQQFLKKIEDLKNGIRKTQTEMKNVEKECTASENKKKELSQQLKAKNEQLAGLNTATQQMDHQLAEGHLHRQKNLEVLVRLQRKSRLYNELKNSRYKLLFRNESTLDSESQKQKSTNANLISILEALIQDFPSLQMPFTGVLNSLRVSTSY